MAQRYQSEVRQNLHDVLATELDHEHSGTDEAPGVFGDKEFVDTFLSTHGWSLTDEDEENSVLLSRETADGDTVEIEFDTAVTELEEFKDTEGNEHQMPSEPAPTTLSVRVFRAEIKSCVSMEVTFQSDNVYFDKVQVHSRELEEGETDADLYSGPNYDSLDPALQEALAAYVTELGVSHDLFRFIEAYAVIKEQREYTDWLTRFKNFL